VVAVILYHFKLPGFGGGFAGVDIFFVISGFLMTGIIVLGLEAGAGAKAFSLLSFYWARARRIIPALLVLCVSLLGLGWLFLTAVDYRMLSSHAVASLAFLSNVQFWREAGYFDASSHEKWLLHTWSLSVEWQFYLLLPLFLLALWKWRPGRKPVFVALVAGCAVSFALSLALTPSSPSFAFYLLPARAWEMFAGGLVFLSAPRLALSTRQGAWLEIAGFALIGYTVLFFDAAMAWPGWRALVPVLGTVAVLLAARNDSAWSGKPVAQWLGKRSYSLYLWHWPAVVALVYLERQGDPRFVGAALLLTVMLGHLSYHLVEVRAQRFLGKAFALRSAVVIVAPIVLVAGVAVLIWKMDGIRGRYPAATDMVAAESANLNPRQLACFARAGVESPSCVYGGQKVAAILLGDSHADAITTAFAAAVPTGDEGILGWTYISCPTLFGVRNLSPKYGAGERCGAFLDWAMERLDAIPKEVPLVIVNRTTTYALGHNESWEGDAGMPAVYFTEPHATADPNFLKEFAARLASTACTLAKQRPVYLVRPIPEMGVDVPKAMGRALLLGRERLVSITLDEYHKRHAFVWAAQDAARERCGIKILDPLPYLCRDGRCFGDKDGRPIYYDDDHLSEFGNKLLVPMFREVFAGSGAQ
jgi:peptidoglycan/LPS O-acetylase OafA/YrhL